jgi:hypothetical protein
MIRYFIGEESPYYEGKFVVKINHEKLPVGFTRGSYNLLAARVMNLSYAQYLRFCRDQLNAEIIGKNNLYPVAYFSNDRTFRAFIELLNKRMELIMYDRKTPVNE